VKTAGLFARVLSTEGIKLKRTLALGMVVIAPFVIVALYFMIGYIGGARAVRSGADYWPAMVQNTLGLWTIIMMPLFLTLQTSLLAGVEHADRNWKSLLALPAPRWMVYVSKWVVTVAMLGGAHVVLVAGTVASGALLREVQPALAMKALPLTPLVPSILKISATALLALTIQHWVSLRWQSFTAAMGFGMCAMVIGFVAVNSPDFGPWFPWSMSIYSLRPKPDAPDLIAIALAASTAGVVLGAWEFSRRDVA
jgi:hypothetical protein